MAEGWNGISWLISEDITSPNDKIHVIHDFDGCIDNTADFANTKINNEVGSLIVGGALDSGWNVVANFDGIIHSVKIYDVTNDGYFH